MIVKSTIEKILHILYYSFFI